MLLDYNSFPWTDACHNRTRGAAGGHSNSGAARVSRPLVLTCLTVVPRGVTCDLPRYVARALRARGVEQIWRVALPVREHYYRKAVKQLGQWLSAGPSDTTANAPDPFGIVLDCVAGGRLELSGFAQAHFLLAYDEMSATTLAVAVTEGRPKAPDWLSLLPPR